MKANHNYRLGLVFLIALLVGPLLARQAEAQATRSCDTVTMRIFPVKPGNADLEERVSASVGRFLCSINADSPDVSGIEITSEDIDILSNSETLHPVYKILLIPVVPMQGSIAYQVRGLHLDHDSGEDLQLALSLDSDGNVLEAEVVDEEERSGNWSRALDEIGSLPEGDAVLSLIRRLEDAYNEDAEGVANGERTMPKLSELLEDATINVSKLISGAPTRTTYPSADRYVNALVRLIGRAGGAPSITYELIQIYPHRDSVSDNGTGVYEEASIYRVALVQHWMFPPDNYIDTDFVSLDVEINPSPYIKARNAGRGSFTVDTNPDGMQVTEINGMDWQEKNVTTPLAEFINAPWQFHYLTLDDTWYKTHYLVASPDEVLQHDTLVVDMEHEEGNIDLIIRPNDDNVSVKVENDAGNLVDATFIDGILQVDVDQLKGKPDPAGAVTEDYATRDVRLVIEKPYYQTVDTTITLPSPELYPVTITMKKKLGRLVVTTTPSPSSVHVDGVPFADSPVDDNEVEVTGDDPPLKVTARNDECYSGMIEQDCVLHIPSKAEEARIEENQTTEVHLDLGPFIVRNLAKTAVLNVELDRPMDSDSVAINVGITDKDDRNRAYIVDFQMLDRETGDLDDMNASSFACYSENEAACVGKGIRPSSYSMNWGGESALPDNTVPVLTLRRRNICWPCVLIPAAAGVASAYIFPRTGSGGPLPFLPPPRPDDIP